MEADEAGDRCSDAGDLMAPRSESADGESKRASQGLAQGGGQGGGQGAGAGAGAGPGKQYTCPHCSYSADKKVSLNR